MLNTSPQTITNELIGRLSCFTLESTPSEFEFQLLLREAKKLEKSNESESMMLSGIIYSLMGKYTETKNLFEDSLATAPRDFNVVVLNYVRSLKVLGKFDEAYKVIKKHLSTDNVELTTNAYHHAVSLGLFNDAKEYCEILKLFPSYSSAYLDSVEVNIASCEALNVDVKDIHKVHLLVFNEIYNQQKPPLLTSLEVNEDSNSLILLFYVDADADSITKIELNIIEKLSHCEIAPIIEHKITPVVLKGTN